MTPNNAPVSKQAHAFNQGLVDAVRIATMNATAVIAARNSLSVSLNSNSSSRSN